MATATPAPTPNPDAMKYTLDMLLPEPFNATSAGDLGNSPFAEVFDTVGVASIFGTNDFVTVTRLPGGDWALITAAVQAAAEKL